MHRSEVPPLYAIFVQIVVLLFNRSNHLFEANKFNPEFVSKEGLSSEELTMPCLPSLLANQSAAPTKREAVRRIHS